MVRMLILPIIGLGLSVVCLIRSATVRIMTFLSVKTIHSPSELNVEQLLVHYFTLLIPRAHSFICTSSSWRTCYMI